MRLVSVSRIVFVFLTLTGLALAAGVPAGEEQTWEGHITDEMCGSEHMMDGMTHPECALACMEMGAALQLYVPADEAIYAIDDQEKAEEFAGTDVTVTGVLSDDGETVTIHSIAARESS